MGRKSGSIIVGEKLYRAVETIFGSVVSEPLPSTLLM